MEGSGNICFYKLFWNVLVPKVSCIPYWRPFWGVEWGGFVADDSSKLLLSSDRETSYKIPFSCVAQMFYFEVIFVPF